MVSTVPQCHILGGAEQNGATSGLLIDAIPRYALIPAKLATLVSKIGQVDWAESAFCYMAHRPNNNSNLQAVLAGGSWRAN